MYIQVHELPSQNQNHTILQLTVQYTTLLL